MKKLFLWATIFVALAGICHAETVFWSDNFDSGATNRWTTTGTNTVWKISSPTSGPSTNSLGCRTHSGAYCANTAGYSVNQDVRIVCTNYNGASSLLVPSTNQFPRLRFWHWFNELPDFLRW